eukprot:COSAG02_NODE_13752_length_1354_cov_0.680478_3_plen_80_part_00
MVSVSSHHLPPFLYQQIHLLLCERKLRVALVSPEDGTACWSARYIVSSGTPIHRRGTVQSLTDLGCGRSRCDTKLLYHV